MKVYKCVFTGDEVISDSYKQLAPFGRDEFMDIAFEVESKRILKGSEDYGISHNTEDGEVEIGTTDAETVNDIIDAFKLESTPFSKKEYMLYIKGYVSRLKGYLEQNNPDRVEKFMQNTQAFVKVLLERFNDLEFYLGPSLDCEGIIIYGYYNDGDLAPRFIYFRDSLKEERY
ncbi:translationally-controlled tumor protein, putative [Cryptosporidium muris RN66]|uniref:Translationally-controlled tumor protein, putative n=1 Tax=Cryptosporidium muris (strain RN66) TaxID=441375 RepID=B6AGF1_CRYMR|nr:translationally-controlled tumor protein, putative [Cryptosporidium muris RN66]EEA07292.1 translationally-controlled tumor protein, putative [Cryptosporidium muris RN66]|eukprot:XP_002141641.1 translationally-controlled tumor protein [Cryptosporidium muris RN66]